MAARNQDDHTRNFAFLLREGGAWELAPAFDITFAMDPGNRWLSAHQMSVAGKFEDIGRSELLQVADRFSIGGTANAFAQVNASLAEWPAFAAEAGLGEAETARIAGLHQSL